MKCIKMKSNDETPEKAIEICAGPNFSYLYNDLDYEKKKF